MARTPTDAGPTLVPAELARLWNRSGSSGRGRPAELDVDRVVRAAVALADREGLDGVTLPKLGRTLGYSPMALYRYVGSKDTLLLLMRDAALGPAPAIDTAPDAWREGLRQWADAERLVHRDRPWLARLPVSGPPVGPNAVGWMEAGLRTLRGTRLAWPEKLALLTLVTGYVRQTILLAQDLERGRRAAGLDRIQAARRYGRELLALIDRDRFPETARMLQSGIFEPPPKAQRKAPADPDFTFGLERILDGAETAIARAGSIDRGRPTSPATRATAPRGR